VNYLGLRSRDRGKARDVILPQRVDGFVLLSKQRSSVLRRDAELHRNDLTKAKMMLRLQSRTPSLLQDCTSQRFRFNCGIRDYFSLSQAKPFLAPPASIWVFFFYGAVVIDLS